MSNGKGSKPRPTNLKKFRDNFDEIFARKTLSADIELTDFEKNYWENLDNMIKADPRFAASTAAYMKKVTEEVEGLESGVLRLRDCKNVLFYDKAKNP